MGTEVDSLFVTLGLKTKKGEWQVGEEAIHRMKEALVGLGIAFGFVELVRGMKEMVAGTVEAAVGAKHMGERIGISAQAVQELGYAASVTGSSAEGLQVGAQKLARGLQQLHTKGTGPVAEGLRSLGVNLNDSEVKTGKFDQVLEIVANRFEKMPDGTAKTAAAMQLFGRQGATLIPLLNRGASGIKALREEAQKLGVVIDEEGVKKAEDFEIAQKRLGATLQGVKNTAVMAMLPALQEAADGILKWAAANQELIKTRVKEFVEGAVGAVRTMVHVLGEVISFVANHKLEVAAGLLIMFAPLLEIVAVIAAVIAGIMLLKKVVAFLTGQGGDDADDAGPTAEERAKSFAERSKDYKSKSVQTRGSDGKLSKAEADDDVSAARAAKRQAALEKSDVMRGIVASGDTARRAAGSPQTVSNAMTYNGGDTHFTINGGSDGAQAIVDKAMAAHDKKLANERRTAVDTFKGGRKS